MSALSLDAEFMQYWQRLSTEEKEALLQTARAFAQAKEREDPAVSRNRQARQQGETYLSGEGKSFTWQDLKQLTGRDIK